MSNKEEIKNIRERIKALGKQGIDVQNLSHYAEAKFKLIEDAPKILARNLRLEKLHLEFISILRLCLEEVGSGPQTFSSLSEWEIRVQKIIKEYENE